MRSMALFSLCCKKKLKRKNSFTDMENGIEPSTSRSRGGGLAASSSSSSSSAREGKGDNMILCAIMVGAVVLYVLILYVCVLLFSSPDPANYNKINDPFKYVIDTNVQKHLEDNADVGHHNLESLMLEGLPPKNWGKIKKDAEALLAGSAIAAAAAANSSDATAAPTTAPTTMNTAASTTSSTSITFVINSSSVGGEGSNSSVVPVLKSEMSRTTEKTVGKAPDGVERPVAGAEG